MRPFCALLLDSYRDLKSQTIFWITLGLSGLVALVFLSIGFDEKGITIFFGATSWEQEFSSKDSPLAYVVYTMLFSNVVAGIWLTFIAIILALISCASIFPDALKEGSAGMLMTKKPSRLEVFLAKLTGSLFFVFVQVGLFVVIVFLAFRWRLGMWNFSLLWYIPAVLLVFLNLYSVMVLVGVKTKSVMTSILIAMVVWGISACLNWAVTSLTQQYEMSKLREATAVEGRSDEVAEERDEAADEGEATRTVGSSREIEGEGDPTLKSWRDTLKTIHWFLPKNSPIMAEAERKVVFGGLDDFGGLEKLQETFSPNDREAFEDSLDELAASDSKFYSIGTSCLFSLVMLSLAAWFFCRKEI